MNFRHAILAASLAAGMSACEEVLEIDAPTNALSVEETYSTPEGTRAAVTGLYAQNYLSTGIFYQTIDVYLSMFSDELIYYRTSSAEYYASDWTATTTIFNTIWNNCYNTIYRSNDIIANMTGSTVLPEDETNEGLGAAYFFRALCHFWLASMYGDCPLVLSNVYTETQHLPREASATVMQQVEKDLQTAYSLLEKSDNPKTRVTQDAAAQLLSRVYLYQEKWQDALAEANKVLPSADGGSGGTKYLLETLDRAFRASNKEAVMQIDMEGYIGSGTYIGFTRYYYSYFHPYKKYTPYFLSGELAADLKSDTADQRPAKWLGQYAYSADSVQYYPYKYKNEETPASADDYEYVAFMRLAELYLTRAECNAHLGNLADAVKDINKIRNRAGQADFAATTSQEEVLSEVMTQRRKEFFSEMGHRWFDLKRTGKADEVYSKLDYKTGWTKSKILFPIPYSQILANPALTQNEGY